MLPGHLQTPLAAVNLAISALRLKGTNDNVA